VRVRVEREDGEPVAGATLELELGAEQLRLSNWSIRDFRREETSDADGRAEFRVPPVGVFTIHVEREGFAPARLAPVVPGDDLVLILSRGRTVSGQVRSQESGAPIAGAGLRFSGDRLRRFTTSDGGGGFQFEDLPDGPLRLDALAEGFDLERLRELDADGEREGPLVVELSPGADLSGTLADLAGGEPIAGASVELRLRREFGGEGPPARLARTDANGAFRFARVSRTGLELAFTAAGYAESVERLDLDPEEAVATERYTLQTEAELSGLVHRAEGPLPAGRRGPPGDQ
jgi:hypothetical protein